MRKSVFLICGILFAYSDNCMAVEPIMFGADFQFNGCVTVGCGGHSWYPLASPSERNCKDYTLACVYMDGNPTGVASCYSCNYGYDLVKHSSGIAACSQFEYDKDDNSGGVNSYSYTSCEKNCSSSNCYPDSWKALRTGYESRTNRSCSATGASGTCNASTQYRCAAGYYGSSANGTSGCTQCPTWTGVYTNSARTTLARGTSSAGATAITGCYVVSGTYYDATGTFKLTGNCTYK